jgi:hypothetical protein
LPGRQPTVYLHVGIAKTGTTYLQDLLWHNRGILDRHGLRNPGKLPDDHFRASVDLRQTPFAGNRQSYVPGAWDALAAAAVAAPDRAVVSHETLTRTRVEQVHRAAASLRPAEVHVVVTARDLARQLPAVWQEHVKNRGATSYERFLRAVAELPRAPRHRKFWEAQDILGVLDRWSAAVPPERVHVVTVPQPGAAPGLLWERFASVLGVDPAVVDTDVPVSNVSLGVAEAEALRRMNPAFRRLDWATYEKEVKWGLAVRLAARTGTARLGVPVGRRAWVSERAEEMIAGLRERGYDIVGDLEELRPVFDDSRVVMPRDVPAGRLMQISGECLGDLMAEHALRRQRLRALVRVPGPGSHAGRQLRRLRHRFGSR